ncbi:MAG: polysaccharide deacetylase family protein [Marinilabiliaceae bacterium]|nr:polysaccharide deacetylase family protein [Marinilabiliaceae bacterium]
MAFLIIILLSLVALAIVAYGSANIHSGMFIEAVCKNPDSDKVMLTYDDGPDPINTPKLLDVLDKYNIKATFFMIGEKVDKYPDIVKEVAKRGHTIGNHTYFHNPWHNFHIHRQYMSELKRTDESMRKLGIDVKDFRPPLGITTPTVASSCTRMKYRTWGWTIRSFDTMSTPREKVVSRVVKRLKPKAIILLHDRMDDVDIVTEKIIIATKEKGLSL